MGDTSTDSVDAIGRDTLATTLSDSTAGVVTTLTQFDLLDRPILTTTSVPGQALSVHQAFDKLGNLDTLQRWSSPDPNHIGTVTRVYAYDEANRKISETLLRVSGDSGCAIDMAPITWTYDLAGNLLDGGPRPTTNTFDVLNRRIQAVGSDTSIFGYDAAGHLLFANNSSARIARTYNPNGTLATDTLRIATGHIEDQDFTVHVYGLEYGYDLDGHRIAMGEGGGDTVHYGYDAQSGLLTTLTSVFGTAFHYHYDNGERLIELSRLLVGKTDSATEVYAYDGDARTIGRLIQEPGYSQPFHHDSLVYDRAGRVSQNVLTGERVAYSAFGALKYADYNNNLIESFVTDALGDRVSDTTYSTTNGERVYHYWPGTDRLRWMALPTASPGDTTTYCQGNYGELGDEDATHWFFPADSMTVVPWTESRDRNNTYNRQQQLIKMAFTLDSTPAPRLGYQPFHTTETYRYDALGRRVWVRMLRDTTIYCNSAHGGCVNTFTRTVWDGDEVLKEFRATGDTLGQEQESDDASGKYAGIAAYTNGGNLDTPLELNGAQLYTNWRGQLDATDGTGIYLPAAQDGEPSYGAVAGAVPDSALPWHGTLVLSMTDGSGYQYKRNRYYDPTTGRFTQEDPLGLAGGLNAYGYADSDPITYADPFGLCPPCGLGTSIGLLTGIRNAAEQERHIQELPFWMTLFGLSAAASGNSGDNEPLAGLGAAAEGEAAAAAAAAGGDHIVLGLAAHGLEETAAEVGGRTLLNDPNWKQTLLSGIANPNTKFTISLDGLSGSSTYSKIMSAVQRGLAPNASPTNWELGQLYQSGRLKSVQFVQGGRRVANPF